MEINYFQARAVGPCGMKSKKTLGTDWRYPIFLGVVI